MPPLTSPPSSPSSPLAPTLNLSSPTPTARNDSPPDAPLRGQGYQGYPGNQGNQGHPGNQGHQGQQVNAGNNGVPRALDFW